MGLLSLILRMGYDDSDVRSGIKRTEAAVGSHVKKISNEFKAGLASYFTIGAVTNFTRSVIQAGDRIGDLADQWHLSTDEVQRLEVLANRTGVKIERLGESLIRFSDLRQKAATGDEKAQALLSKYGVTLSDVNDTTKSNLDLVTVISTRYNELATTTEAQADALDIAGQRGQKVLSVMNQIKDLGPIKLISADDIKAMSEANDALDELIRQAKVAMAPRIGFWGAVVKRGNELDQGGDKFALSNAFFETLMGWNPNTHIQGGERMDAAKVPESARASFLRRWSGSGQLYGSDNPAFTMAGRSMGESMDVPTAPGFGAVGGTSQKDGRFSRPSTGNLASIGGLYFGADYNTRLMSIQQKHVQIAERIADNTRKTAETLSGDATQ